MVYAPLWHTAIFTISRFLSEISRISGNDRGRYLRNFYFFIFFQELTEIPAPKCSIHRKNMKKNFFKVCPPWLGSEEIVDF